MSLKSKVERLEKKLGGDDERGARALVEVGLELGILNKSIDVEKTVQEFVGQGLTLKSLLEEIDGSSLGLPCLRDEVG